ncbi:ParA family protein [Haloferax marisrubri]|uniref:ParA family protein n=1 Tax=Haloferax marisrubri TaxID=1544719 RepID=A0A2P4NM40_9EURY|nr:ParA family protein [Haloferax marisrubri]POG54171.1 ParA family protein [Haloferax marisrubri]
MSQEPQPNAVALNTLKGGVGKTTISLNTARELAERDHDVLLVDLDPNGHLTVGLNFREVYLDDEHADLGEIIIDRDAEPDDAIVSTEFGFDLFPSTADLEDVQDRLGSVNHGTVRMRQFLVEPLLGDTYDYIIIDTPGSTGHLTDNALVATESILVPLRPGPESLGGFERTVERLIKPLREFISLDLLAIVPTDLQRRIDQQTLDRELIESLVTREHLAAKVPNFAYISPADLEKIDSGEWDGSLPKPGIRHSESLSRAIGDHKPLRDYAPEDSILSSFEELASIIEHGEVRR